MSASAPALALARYRCRIGGAWHEAEDGRTFESLDPYTRRPWAEIARCGPREVDRAVRAARAAFEGGEWPAMTPSARGRLLVRLGEAILVHAERLADIESRDNGKPLAEMRGHVRGLADWFFYYGGLVDKIEGSVVPVSKPGMFAFTRREPLGVCVAITPWNSPLMLAVWKLAPGLAAGNTFVLKPSEATSASALELAAVFEEAGLPPGVLNVVTGYGHELGEALVTHPMVSKITFTGGNAAGEAVAVLAARSAKRVTLELGGKSPNVVFADADLEDAARGVAAGIFAASGQTCVAGSRLVVEESVADALLERVVQIAQAARLGDPRSEETQVGPITTEAQFRRIESYVALGRDEGAACVLGGESWRDPASPAAQFMQPTIFDGVRSGMTIACEEIFGPVLSVLRFRDECEALAIANDTPYGLAAGVWTRDIRRALEMSSRIEAGTVWVNTYRAANFQMPFGGYKSSGHGRENGLAAINDYLQTKSVWIGLGETSDPFRMR